ncbi:glycosyltransferase [Candidatus Liberibacter sp.]|uniref:UDP-N-acetylglucosamine--N-acetylmuramyl- (pentapeptide) pyrophosphoryl-undecaprenol N-acetylglucosamine transferase n=1 Tax=Candidatus Liberibacter sp. TaxID=34022 RepID=UPI0015F5C8A5|nr:UDP-N-acetylglucosamine--N-acetylmuramyl-(pentapeptide) pyrophosphoryl-undecaprenol N-acetylglucosamine transferase [Candidatus Liberibacter sp.]MBA5724054.1 UDP-N-acetylglucosamine--N-acetylmuramyl-(pentapeptide) pyrophosphoryl-undecaprenol N-acetylglucosamine transferase [Candidatus Liberibacter sp.]
MPENNKILLVSGGSGGHVFPAVALSGELKKRGYVVHLMTDNRGIYFSKNNLFDDIHEVPSFKIRLCNPIVFLHSMIFLWKGFVFSWRLMRKTKPKAVVGFGACSTLAPLFAAIILRIPTMIHEQNVVMGRANRLLSFGVKIVALGLFLQKKGHLSRKTVVTGNPVRPALLKASVIPYKASYSGEPFRLMIFGGSQGAKIFSEVVPKAIDLMPLEQRQRLVITQQVKLEEREEIQRKYDKIGLKVEISAFFENIEEYISSANLLICRSGASTVSEISVVGRPSILVPYPHAISHDQQFNAMFLQEGGGAEVLSQDSFTPERLAASISAAMEQPDRLIYMARQAAAKGNPGAITSLANVVELLARKEDVSSLRREGICKFHS